MRLSTFIKALQDIERITPDATVVRQGPDHSYIPLRSGMVISAIADKSGLSIGEDHFSDLEDDEIRLTVVVLT